MRVDVVRLSVDVECISRRPNVDAKGFSGSRDWLVIGQLSSLLIGQSFSFVVVQVLLCLNTATRVGGLPRQNDKTTFRDTDRADVYTACNVCTPAEAYAQLISGWNVMTSRSSEGLF